MKSWRIINLDEKEKTESFLVDAHTRRDAMEKGAIKIFSDTGRNPKTVRAVLVP